MVQELDEGVDRILKKLDALGLSERTVVVFFSDNGGLSTSEGSPTCNLPLRAGKGWNYEGGIRVPLMVRMPGRVAAGTTNDVPVISNDLYPTLLELAGVPLPPNQAVDAVSLVPLLDRKGPIAERPLYWHYPHYSNQGGRPAGALRSGDWKLVEWFEDGRVELFDLAADPGELRDLAAAQPERAASMQKQLADWRVAVGAQMPSPNPKPVDPFPPQPQKPEK
jgi:arylsulfatase A-like enzyme